jgi:hypothetical protein
MGVARKEMRNRSGQVPPLQAPEHPVCAFPHGYVWGSAGFILKRMLRAGATWAIEDLSYGRNRWLVNRVLNAASYSRITTTLTLTFPLQQRKDYLFGFDI